MRSAVLSIHPGLAGSSRFSSKAAEENHSHLTSLFFLVGAGICATLASAYLDFSLRIPGHAILRSVFPMALGLSFAPRRMGGTVMGISALGSAMLINVGGLGTIGAGALTSLVITGPLLDLVLWHARKGWRLYLAFAAAGLGSNFVALAIRAGVKFTGMEHITARPMATWILQALVTYTICGILAGLLSAAVWFRFSADGCNEKSSEIES